jgi:hypothetical protein
MENVDKTPDVHRIIFVSKQKIAESKRNTRGDHASFEA